MRRAALALARDVERRMPGKATSKWWKEERQGVFLDYNQNAKDRTVASAYSVRPLPDARVSMPMSWDEVPTCEAEAFTIATVPARFASIGDPGAGIDDAVGSRMPSSNCRRSTRRKARATRRGRRTTENRPVSRRGSSRPASAGPIPSTSGRGEAGGPPPEVAAERAAAVAAGDRNAGLPTEWEGSRPTPTGRRRTTVPVIEISRAHRRPRRSRGSIAGSHVIRRPPKRSSPRTSWSTGCEAARRCGIGAGEPDPRARGSDLRRKLDPDYDPWAGYEWPDRAGQLERAPRKKVSES